MCPQLVEAAEAKAYYGLARNYGALQALVEVLVEREMLTGPELEGILEGAGEPRGLESAESVYSVAGARFSGMWLWSRFSVDALYDEL